ncbi:hypothetical protein Syun_019659 [Stephania yunnanensis]|uniref:Uncharacterized protein n=1 Tax=Stephania yunnanensis TaxID=152371 RepID=A0AAP0IWI5_9MAGN
MEALWNVVATRRGGRLGNRPNHQRSGVLPGLWLIPWLSSLGKHRDYNNRRGNRCAWVGQEALTDKFASPLLSQIPEEIVGEAIAKDRLFDAINVILSMQIVQRDGRGQVESSFHHPLPSPVLISNGRAQKQEVTHQNYVPTIFNNFNASVVVDGQTMSLSFWDTADNAYHRDVLVAKRWWFRLDVLVTKRWWFRQDVVVQTGCVGHKKMVVQTGCVGHKKMVVQTGCVGHKKMVVQMMIS